MWKSLVLVLAAAVAQLQEVDAHGIGGGTVKLPKHENIAKHRAKHRPKHKLMRNAVVGSAANTDFLAWVQEHKVPKAHKMSTNPKHGGSAPYWPFKGGNVNHSGFSLAVGAHDMSKPSWIFTEPDVQSKGEMVGPMKVFHGSPVIDGEKNVYIQSTTGWVYSLNLNGTLRWSLQLDDGNPGNMALLEGYAYTCSQDGQVYAIDTEVGEVVWKTKATTKCPDDTHSLTAVGDTILTACNAVQGAGGMAVCALSASDGSTKWTYDVSSHGSRGYNHVHAVVGDSVIFGDIAGGAYKVSLIDGSEQWYQPGVEGAQFTTAGLTVGSNNLAFNGFNVGSDSCGGPNTTGLLRAHDLETGKVTWQRNFSEGVNAVPAVGPLGAKFNNRLAVIVAVGNDLECEPSPVLTKVKNAQIYALDANTGETIWRYDAPQYNMSCAGNTPDSICCPDIWGQPSLGADGTVYANWSGGYSIAIKDTNGDGLIDTTDPAEFSSFNHGQGSNSNTALAPGLTVAASCTKLMGYVS